MLIIAFQIGLYYFWKLQNSNKVKLSMAIEELKKPNLVMEYSNKATSHYFEADNYFAKYLQNYDPKMLDNYKNSLKNMSGVLDTLGNLSTNDEHLSDLVENKFGLAQEMAKIKRRLDSLIQDGFSSIGPQKFEIPLYDITNLDVKKLNVPQYNPTNALKSITYDTIYHKGKEPEKEGLFGRLGKAIAGKSDVKQDQVEIRVTMTVGNKPMEGSIAEQLKSLSDEINKYYKTLINQLQIKIQNDIKDRFKNNFSTQVKSTYENLKSKDNEILSLNENILNNSKNIINFYSSTANELNDNKNERFIVQYNKDLDKQVIIVENLLIGMGITTLFLLLYTLIANDYENKLQKSKSKAEQNDELKTRILGMLSHEMRAPLNIISNQSLQLRENLNSKETINVVDSILFNSNSLNLTVNQILEFIKNENSELKFYNVNLVLKNEIEAITNSLKTLAETKKIELVSNSDESTKQLVWADSVKIHQLFYNLIGNAIKFTQHGVITVKSNLETLEDKFKYNVSIIDTGEGISGEDLPNIFNKYFQSKNQKSNHKLGIGLGLSLCKEIVELYGGEISISSAVGIGSEVSFYMFFEFPHLTDDTSKGKLLELKNLKSKKVAIVDDDTFIRNIIKKQLEEINFTVYEFDSSQKMINFLNESLVDLIITDIQLPEISGFDLVNLIRKLKNENAKIPVIAITGDHTFNLKQAESNQINEFLIKPINKEEFYQKILKLLKTNQA